MSDIKQCDNAKNRSCIYGLLACIYKEEPSLELLGGIVNSDFSRLLKTLGLDLGKDIEKKPVEELVDELAVEYTRLFLGPGKHIHPNESAYRHDESDVSDRYIKGLVEFYGLKFDKDFHDKHDHISVELEFMGKTTEAEAEAWRKEDRKKAAKILELEKKFIDGHLMKWVPRFSEVVIAQASSSFYREMAKLTKEYVLLEARNMNHLISRR